MFVLSMAIVGIVILHLPDCVWHYVNAYLGCASLCINWYASGAQLLCTVCLSECMRVNVFRSCPYLAFFPSLCSFFRFPVSLFQVFRE